MVETMIQTSKVVRALLWNCREIDRIMERFLFSEAFLGVSLMKASKNSRIKTSTFSPKRTQVARARNYSLDYNLMYSSRKPASINATTRPDAPYPMSLDLCQLFKLFDSSHCIPKIRRKSICQSSSTTERRQLKALLTLLLEIMPQMTQESLFLSLQKGFCF